jgi:prepilin peptidase CpaA
MYELSLNIILLILLVISLYTDIKDRKIYNKHTFSVLFIAIITSLMFEGFAGFKNSIYGAGIGFMIMLIPYMLGGMGAGDVKLFMAIGSLKGVDFIIQSSIITFIVGGVIAALVITINKNWKETLINIKSLFIFKETLNNSYTYPYGIAICIGTVITYLLR